MNQDLQCFCPNPYSLSYSYQILHNIWLNASIRQIWFNILEIFFYKFKPGFADSPAKKASLTFLTLVICFAEIYYSFHWVHLQYLLLCSFSSSSQARLMSERMKIIIKRWFSYIAWFKLITWNFLSVWSIP